MFDGFERSFKSKKKEKKKKKIAKSFFLESPQPPHGEKKFLPMANPYRFWIAVPWFVGGT